MWFIQNKESVTFDFSGANFRLARVVTAKNQPVIQIVIGYLKWTTMYKIELKIYSHKWNIFYLNILFYYIYIYIRLEKF